MPYWIFTEDEDGKFGSVGHRESRAAAEALAGDYMGITHVEYYDTYDRAEAKRYFKGGITKEDLSVGHRNIKNESTLEVF